MLTTLLVFVIILAVLVLSHEFGHFLAARRFGVKVEEFGFGFPPRILGFKKGETRYSINWLPLGGFVKIKGENGEHTTDSDSFGYQRVWRRLVMLSAGVVMNLLAAAVLLSLGFGLGLPGALDNLGRGAQVRDQKIEVVDVLSGSPAERAGVKVGEAIWQADKLIQPSFTVLQNYLTAKVGQPVRLVFKSNGDTAVREIAPVILSQTGKGGIGVALFGSGLISYPWYLAIYHGFEATGFYLFQIVRAFWFFIIGLWHGAPLGQQISGPVGIAVLTGRAARLGFAYLLQFTALLSINLAVINVLPFPALDGGRILFLIIEKWRGRPVRQKVEQAIHALGFFLLMLLVVAVTVRDFSQFNLSLAKFRSLFWK